MTHETLLIQFETMMRAMSLLDIKISSVVDRFSEDVEKKVYF